MTRDRQPVLARLWRMGTLPAGMSMMQPLWKMVREFLKWLIIDIVYHLQISHLDMYQET